MTHDQTSQDWEIELEEMMPDLMITTQVEPRALNEYKVKAFIKNLLAKEKETARREEREFEELGNEARISERELVMEEIGEAAETVTQSGYSHGSDEKEELHNRGRAFGHLEAIGELREKSLKRLEELKNAN